MWRLKVHSTRHQQQPKKVNENFQPSLNFFGHNAKKESLAFFGSVETIEYRKRINAVHQKKFFHNLQLLFTFIDIVESHAIWRGRLQSSYVIPTATFIVYG